MQLKVIFLGLLLVVVAMSSRTTSQAHLSAKNSNLGQILKKTSLGNGLISLVKMFSANKQDGTEKEWQDLYEALQLLKDSLKAKEQAENDDFAADGVVHSAEATRINTLLSEYRGAAGELEDTLDRLETKRSVLDLELKNQNGQLDNAYAGRDNEIEYLENAATAYEAQFNDYAEAIQLLGQAIEKLNEAQLQAGNAGFTNFLQTNAVNFQTFSVLLESSVSNIKLGKSFYMKPISNVFVQLQNNNAENIEPSRIQGAINALSDLIAHLQKGQIQLTTDHNNDVQTHTDLLNNYKQEIDQLLNVMIPATQDQLDLNKQNYDITNESLQSVLSNIRIEEGYLAEEMESWAKRQEMHDILIPKLQSEYQIVESAEQLLQESRPDVQQEEIVIEQEQGEQVGDVEIVDDQNDGEQQEEEEVVASE